MQKLILIPKWQWFFGALSSITSLLVSPNNIIFKKNKISEISLCIQFLQNSTNLFQHVVRSPFFLISSSFVSLETAILSFFFLSWSSSSSSSSSSSLSDIPEELSASFGFLLGLATLIKFNNNASLLVYQTKTKGC